MRMEIGSVEIGAVGMRICNSGGHQRPDLGVVVMVVRCNPPVEPTRRNNILQRHHHHPSNLDMPPSSPPSSIFSPWTGGKQIMLSRCK